MHWYLLGCAGMHWDVLGGTGIHWYLLKCTGISWDGRSAIPGAVKILHSTLQFQPHRKSLQEITAGNPGRKSWQEILVGNLHRKSPQEILAGNAHRKSSQDILVGNLCRKSLQEILTGNPGRKSRQEISAEILTGNPHRKSLQEIPTRNPHRKSPQEIRTIPFQPPQTFPSRVFPISFSREQPKSQGNPFLFHLLAGFFFFSPLIDLISVFSSQIQLPHHPLPQIFIFFAWQEAKRERGGGERKRKEKIV